MGKKIVFCNCGGERISSDRLQTIENNLIKLNASIIILSDLCGLTVLDKDKLHSVFCEREEFLIIGCYSRSMKLLLEKANVDPDRDVLKYINFIELTNEEISQEVSSFCGNNNQITSIDEISATSDWPSWFPIIDYTRCSGCGQCADFCLFGVYEKNPNGVQVINPRGCKNNCPACARICPQAAIVFPKYKQGGAIGGSEKIDEIAEQSRQTRDIREILGGDIYNALEGRKLKRKSIILQEAMRRAQDERNMAIRENRH